MVKTVFEKEKLRIKVDTEENLVSCEANWEDPDNTEEWFCHLGKDLDELIKYTIILGKIYTYDRKWYIITYDCRTFTIYNTTFNVSFTFSKEELGK